MTKRKKPMHPGEILREEFLKPLGISQYRLAKGIGVQPTRVNQIVKDKAGISADTALRLARYFGTTAEFWVHLQTHHDLEAARDRIGRRLEDELSVHVA